jgi:hypothetical protein
MARTPAAEPHVVTVTPPFRRPGPWTSCSSSALTTAASSSPTAAGYDNRAFDAEYVAETLARAAGVRVHRVRLPADFSVMDEDGPTDRLTFEDVRDWWAALCEAECRRAADDVPPPADPTLGEQLLAVVESAGVGATDEVRSLVARLERAVLKGMGGGHE